MPVASQNPAQPLENRWGRSGSELQEGALGPPTGRGKQQGTSTGRAGGHGGALTCAGPQGPARTLPARSDPLTRSPGHSKCLEQSPEQEQSRGGNRVSRQEAGEECEAHPRSRALRGAVPGASLSGHTLETRSSPGTPRAETIGRAPLRIWKDQERAGCGRR